MKNTENQGNRCNDCEQMFEDNIHDIVNEVDGYTHKDHRNKSEEVHEAYDNAGKRPASYDKSAGTIGNTVTESVGKSAGNVAAKVGTQVKSAAAKAESYVEKTAEKAAVKIGDGVKTAAAATKQFADKTADKVTAKIDRFEAGRSDYDKKQ